MQQQNTISNNTITGSLEEVSQQNLDCGITSAQFYSVLFCVTVVVLVLIISITKLIQSVIFRCNYISPRLKKEIIEEIKKQI